MDSFYFSVNFAVFGSASGAC